MNDFPDFSAHGLQILRELGRNPSGGRVTYLAQQLDQTIENNLVVLKQFQFAKGGNWGGFKAIERETQILKDLQHPGIPCYLSSFETDDGFCLVQEYKDACPLSEPRSFSPDQIKHIATALLEILVYLQDRIPQVFHRDIKPENVLVSDDLQVYLIDFGFARIGSDNLAMSSITMGTFGFMAPEQTRNLQLTTASDLYGLGLTLVCVIAQLKSHEIGEYMDWSNQLDQKAIEAKLKGCSLRFIEWLNQMVAPDPKKRFPDAATALKALKPLYIKRTPLVEFDPAFIDFTADRLGQTLHQTVIVKNIASETTLEGYWEVAPHPKDPPHTPNFHEWISFSPRNIKGNEVPCTITLDTSKLRAESQGDRQLIFHSNAEFAISTLMLRVKTAPRPVKLPVKRHLMEILYILFILVNAIVLGKAFATWNRDLVNAIQPHMIIGMVLFYLIGVVALMALTTAIVGARTVSEDIPEIGVAAVSLVASFVIVRLLGISGLFFIPLELFGVKIVRILINEYYDTLGKPDKHRAYMGFWLRFFLCIVCGVSLGIEFANGLFHNLLIPGIAAASGLGLLYITIAPILEHRRQLAAQRSKEHSLIEP